MKQNSSDRRSENGACVYGAGVLLKFAQALADETADIRAGGKDIEYIHRARVASRRLRAALPLFQGCMPHKKYPNWMKQIRKVTRRLGEARDSDVQIEVLESFQKTEPDRLYRPGVNRLLLRLRQQRAALQGPVTHGMDRFVESGALDEMIAYCTQMAGLSDTVYLFTPGLYQQSFQAIQTRLEDLLAFNAIVAHPEKVTELHQMRIAAKWLRYTLETFGSLYSGDLKIYLQAVKKVQEQLGDIHDCDVWLMFLPQFLDDERQRTRAYFGHEYPMKRLIPGIYRFEQDRQQRRDAVYQEFCASWQQYQDEALWDQLRRTIQVPFPQPESMYPPVGSLHQSEPAPETLTSPDEPSA